MMDLSNKEVEQIIKAREYIIDEVHDFYNTISELHTNAKLPVGPEHVTHLLYYSVAYIILQFPKPHRQRLLSNAIRALRETTRFGQKYIMILDNPDGGQGAIPDLAMENFGISLLVVNWSQKLVSLSSILETTIPGMLTEPNKIAVARTLLESEFNPLIHQCLIRAKERLAEFTIEPNNDIFILETLSVLAGITTGLIFAREPDNMERMLEGGIELIEKCIKFVEEPISH